MFSFLRLAAFALAHASLAGAATSMGEAIGSPIGALVMMNVIALTFEFVSSSVQSLRLLYYEFMGKFFHGEGVPFKPFKLRNPQPLVGVITIIFIPSFNFLSLEKIYMFIH